MKGFKDVPPPGYKYIYRKCVTFKNGRTMCAKNGGYLRLLVKA